jgi:hypothetical protein
MFSSERVQVHELGADAAFEGGVTFTQGANEEDYDAAVANWSYDWMARELWDEDGPNYVRRKFLQPIVEPVYSSYYNY